MRAFIHAASAKQRQVSEEDKSTIFGNMIRFKDIWERSIIGPAYGQRSSVRALTDSLPSLSTRSTQDLHRQISLYPQPRVVVSLQPLGMNFLTLSE
jgi:hypothetical protein